MTHVTASARRSPFRDYMAGDHGHFLAAIADACTYADDRQLSRLLTIYAPVVLAFLSYRGRGIDRRVLDEEYR